MALPYEVAGFLRMLEDDARRNPCKHCGMIPIAKGIDAAPWVVYLCMDLCEEKLIAEKVWNNDNPPKENLK